MVRMTGKRVLAEMLIAEGVEYIFGNPGSSETPLMDVLQDYPQLKYILALQEATAVGMADGYARAAHRPAFANVHIAAGLANALGMLYGAYRGGVPLVLTAGNSDTHTLLTEPTLSGDLVEMTRQYTKWSAQVYHAEEIPMAVRRAFKEAKTPPTGPVFLALPFNILDEEAEVDITPSSQGYFRLRPDAKAVAKAAEILTQAENPVMIVAERVAQCGAVAEAVEMAELLGAQVYAATFSEVNFPTSHPQFLGMLNLHRPANKELLARADVVLAVGTNVFSTFWYSPEPMIGPNTKLVHLDSAAGEVEKIYPTEVAMVADPKVGLEELSQAIRREMSGDLREAARTRVALIHEEKERLKEKYRKQEKASWDREPMSVERMVGELAQVLPADTIIVDESISSRPATLSTLNLDAPGSLYAFQGGGLGWAMGGALGVKLAHPDRPVVAIVGDGASMYTNQALWTAASYNIPVTYVISNNGGYKVLKVNMDIYLREMLKDPERKSEYIGMSFPTPVNVAAIAEGFGVTGLKVEKPAELRGTLEEALASGRPYVIDVAIDSAPYPLPPALH